LMASSKLVSELALISVTRATVPAMMTPCVGGACSSTVGH
jgi:hypothetical protein